MSITMGADRPSANAPSANRSAADWALARAMTAKLRAGPACVRRSVARGEAMFDHSASALSAADDSTSENASLESPASNSSAFDHAQSFDALPTFDVKPLDNKQFDKIERVRQAIAAQAYEHPLAIELAVTRLLERLPDEGGVR